MDVEIYKRIYNFEALTDIWTGDAEGKDGELVYTGLLGSIRWWFEVLVRGLDGIACDPTENTCNKEKHCVVCELFGCEGWARKFHFSVLDSQDKMLTSAINNNNNFSLVFKDFRNVSSAEWKLLELTFKLISQYGAVGGQTTKKPAEKGLIKFSDKVEPFNEIELKTYIKKFNNVVNNNSRASLNNFWFLEKTLDLDSFNKLLKLDSWYRGKIGVSKKIFSFKESPRTESPRTFGFVEDNTKMNEEIPKFAKALNINENNFLKPEQIKKSLFEE